MTAGKALATLTVVVILSMCCILTLMCGMLAGGALGFFTGGAAGWAGGWGSRLPEQRWQFQATPTPRAQVAPRTTPTPQPLTPRRTPQVAPQITPQAPRAPFAADKTGAWIQTVEADSPAEKAGLKVNDLVTQVNGVAVDENHSLSDLIRAKSPGDKVALSVQRGTQALQMEATLGTRKLDTGAEVASLGVTYVGWPMAGPAD